MKRAHSRACLVSILVASATVSAIADIPTLKSSTADIEIQDGNRHFRGFWQVSSTAKHETYYARRSNSRRAISFISDKGRVKFDVKPGGKYDFYIRVNDQPPVLTTISTEREQPVKDLELPIRFGKGNKIHLTGSINGSPPLDLVFDSGAYSMLLYPSGLKKGVTASDLVPSELLGTGGSSKTQYSENSSVELGGLRFNAESMDIMDRQADQADAIIGIDLFENCFVELDFDKMVMRVRQTMPSEYKSGSKLKVSFSGSIPQIEAMLTQAGVAHSLPLTFDLGSTAPVQINAVAAKQFGMPGSMKKIGDASMGGVGKVRIPLGLYELDQLGLGANSLATVPILVDTRSNQTGAAGGHLGMDVLRRYNMVIDLVNDRVILKPNSHKGEPYKHQGSPIKPATVGLTLLAVMSCALGVRQYVSVKRSSSTAINGV